MVFLQDLPATVGISSGGTLIGTGATIVDFAGLNASVTATPTVSGITNSHHFTKRFTWFGNRTWRLINNSNT